MQSVWCAVRLVDVSVPQRGRCSIGLHRMVVCVVEIVQIAAEHQSAQMERIFFQPVMRAFNTVKEPCEMFPNFLFPQIQLARGTVCVHAREPL